MNLTQRYDALVHESGGTLPHQLKPFQLDTLLLLEAGRHVLVNVPTGQGKSLIPMTAARLMGGRENKTKICNPNLQAMP